jgi:lipopolysaccharide biosynthesis regulator YciM
MTDNYESKVQPASPEAVGQVERLLATTDAMVWAEEWCASATKIVAEGRSLIDPGWMVTWFANAIETARSAERDRIVEQIAGHPVTIDMSRILEASEPSIIDVTRELVERSARDGFKPKPKGRCPHCGSSDWTGKHFDTWQCGECRNWYTVEEMQS